MRLLGSNSYILAYVEQLLNQSQPHPPIGQGQVVRRAIPDDERGITFEISRMVTYVRHYNSEPGIVQLARAIVEKCPPKDQSCESRAIFEWLLSRTRFVLDPTRKEVIATPVKMLRDILHTGMVSGDCDELATLLATFLSAIGHKARFVFGARDMGWQHVWVQDLIAGKDVDFDLAERLAPGERRRFTRYGALEIW